ncbi:DUF1501 domain-containing protein, partial [Candidatus Gracilibacteria bacterium]|nr:DUF1501 domain-containing protein [Candidatus Gracilibacteria bacterium]
ALPAQQGFQQALGRLYAETTPRHRRPGTLDVAQTLQSLDPLSYRPASDARYPESDFGMGLRQIAMLMKAEVGLEVACVDLDGWDTHFAQGGGEGLMAGLLDDLAQGLAAFYADLHTHKDRLLVVVMSEFGRRLRENGALGTDHGHGSMMLLLGGGVVGGTIHGSWPGLEAGQLVGPGDLAVTTDYRDVLGEVLMRRLNNPLLESIFPGYTPTFRGVTRGSLMRDPNRFASYRLTLYASRRWYNHLQPVRNTRGALMTTPSVFHRSPGNEWAAARPLDIGGLACAPLRNDSNHYEVINGVLCITTAAYSFHQWVIRRFERFVGIPAEDQQLAFAFSAPIGVLMPDCTNSIVTFLSEANFGPQVLRAGLPVLVLFGLRNCPARRAMQALLAESVARHTDLLSFKVALVDHAPLLAEQYGVTASPTLIVFQHGEPQGRTVGFLPAGLLQLLVKETLDGELSDDRYWSPIEEVLEDVVLIPLLHSWGFSVRRQVSCSLNGARQRGRVDLLVSEQETRTTADADREQAASQKRAGDPAGDAPGRRLCSSASAALIRRGCTCRSVDLPLRRQKQPTRAPLHQPGAGASTIRTPTTAARFPSVTLSCREFAQSDEDGAKLQSRLALDDPRACWPKNRCSCALCSCTWRIV